MGPNFILTVTCSKILSFYFSFDRFFTFRKRCKVLSLRIPALTVLESRRKGKRFCIQYLKASLNTAALPDRRPASAVTSPGTFGVRDDIPETKFTNSSDVFSSYLFEIKCAKI
jgi:hypothetical protein